MREARAREGPDFVGRVSGSEECVYVMSQAPGQYVKAIVAVG
jgi:hypothetical protein